jgi:hypothetical protein
VIGRDFSYALLRAVAAMKETPLQAALERDRARRLIDPLRQVET